MAYVEGPCDQCGLYVPRYELAEVSQEVVTGGKSATYRTYANGKTGYVGGHETYRIERHRLCPGCYEAMLERERAAKAELARQRARARRRALVMVGSIAIAVVLVAAFVSVTGSNKSLEPAASNTVALPDTATAPKAETETPRNANGSTPPDTSNVTETAANTSGAGLSASGVRQPTPVTDTSEEKTASASTTPENTPALSRAVADALNAGGPKPWAADGRSGEVTVGEVRYYEGRPCRSFIYTVGEAPSPTSYACDGVDGIWRPEHRFAR